MTQRSTVEFSAKRKVFVVMHNGHEVASFDCREGHAFDGATDYAARLNGGKEAPRGPQLVTQEEVDRYLTVKEFAERNGVSECTVRLWVRRHDLPHVKLGSIRIPPDAMRRMER